MNVIDSEFLERAAQIVLRNLRELDLRRDSRAASLFSSSRSRFERRALAAPSCAANSGEDRGLGFRRRSALLLFEDLDQRSD